MREILFRAKRIDNDEWVEGSLVHRTQFYGDPDDCYFILYDGEFHCDYYGSVEVDFKTVGQYTGLTDKNGKKIFEGDIVRADDYIFSIKYGKCGGTPNTDNYGYMGFYLEAVSEGTKLCAHYGLRDDVCYFTDIAVIGNIHDNTELLKGGADE